MTADDFVIHGQQRPATGDGPLEETGALLEAFERHFEPSFTLDLRRPAELLTSERFVHAEQWRLPAVWRSLGGPPREPFRSLAVLGLTGIRRATASRARDARAPARRASRR